MTPSASALMSRDTQPLADDSGDDGATAVAQQICLNKTASCNREIATRCARYCDGIGQTGGCLSSCQSDYGYAGDVTRTCLNLLNENMTASCPNMPPDPPPKAVAKETSIDTAAPPDDAAAPAKPAGTPTAPKKASTTTPDTPSTTDTATKKSACSLSYAKSTCRKTASTTTSAKQAGVNGTCTQSTNANVQASNDWGNIASDCTDAITNCNNSCSGDDKVSCNGLTDLRDQALANQNDSSNNGGNTGLGCGQKTGDASPASNNPSNNPTAMSPSSAAAKDCNNPVNNCSAQTASTTPAASDTGTGTGMVGASMAHGIANATGMNVGGDIGGKQGPHFPDPNSQQAAGPGMNPMMGGGGGSSGSGFGQNQNANAGGVGVGGGRGMALASASKADVLKGESSRQGYTGTRGIASVEERRRGGGGGGMGGINFGGGVDEFGHMRGLDLKAYLPGGRADPTRRISGSNSGRPDIHGPHENLFNVVTTRFQVHCKLQMLYDCR